MISSDGMVEMITDTVFTIKRSSLNDWNNNNNNMEICQFSERQCDLHIVRGTGLGKQRSLPLQKRGKAAELLAATQRLAGAVSGDCSAATACSISRTSASSYKLSTIISTMKSAYRHRTNIRISNVDI